MSAPRATYRLQFRGDTDFAKAADLVPYFARLGVSHVYASPLQTARAGSTHGYDGIDFGEIEPAIGGMEGFRAFSDAMRVSGLRLLLDIVPNHMGVTPTNRWWRDVLEWGAASRYRGHFDIDWKAPKLLLPILGRPYAQALAKGELKLVLDGEATFCLAYHDTLLPLTPPSYASILTGGNERQLAIARRLARSTPDTADVLKHQLARDFERSELEACLATVGEDATRLHTLLEMQPWRLLHWRNARERLAYRRFFEISDLVGVRVEDPHVFAGVHRLVLDLVADGCVHGLRIDHVDGLADPLAYLSRLQQALNAPDYYVVVEKILGRDETVRPEWPVAGTTGYEFIALLADLLTDDAKAPELDAAYAAFIGAPPDIEGLTGTIKRRILTHNLANELRGLLRELSALAEADIATRDLGPDALREAVVELAVAMHVYRTYIDAQGAGPEDRAILRAAQSRAREGRRIEDFEALDFLVDVLTLDVAPELQAAALAFTMRFQQTTGPLMAKAVEDTLFYRFNRLIALNEVGGDPVQACGGAALFHARLAARREAQPKGLSTTATHDTKRGEDARARLYALSEMPDAFAMAVRRWTGLGVGHAMASAEQSVPEPEMVWFFYQSLLGAWPPELLITDDAGLAALRERMAHLMQKAAREAKRHTTWTHTDEDYEQALAHFVSRVLDPVRSRAFLEDFVEFAGPVTRAGAINSLTQLLVKLMAPGVPDIYQGTELWDLSLVDPDNRRPVDFARRMALAAAVGARTPEDLVADWRSGALKLRLLMAGLGMRRDLDGWDTAAYLPALANGPLAHHIVGLARRLEHASVLAVGVRLPLTLLGPATDPLVPPPRWGDTRLLPPEGLADVPFHDAVTGDTVLLPRDGLAIADILRRFPVALLSTRPRRSQARN